MDLFQTFRRHPEGRALNSKKNYVANYATDFTKFPDAAWSLISTASHRQLSQPPETKKPPEVSGGFKLGAGAGFEPATFRL